MNPPQLKGISGIQKKILGVLAGNIVGAGIGFVSNVILARLLTMVDFGRINLIFSLVILLYTIGDFGFSTAMLVYYNSHKEENKDLLATLNRCYLEFLSIIFLIMILSVLAIREFYHLSWAEVASISGSLWCFCLYRYGLSVIQALGEWRSYNLLNVLGNVAKALVIPALFAGALIGLNRYDGAIYGYLVGNLVLAILTLVFLGIRARVGTAHSLLRWELWSVVWPLGVANICIIATMRYGVFIVEKALGSERLAVFSAANTLALVLPLISLSIMNVVVRESANSEKTQFLGAILRNQRKYLPFLVVVLLVSMLLAKPVTVLLFGPGYADAGGILAWMLIPYIGGIFFTPLESYLYVHEQKVVMTMKIAQFFIMAAVTSALISRIELYSIVVGTVVSRLAGWAFVYHRARKTIEEAPSV